MLKFKMTALLIILLFLLTGNTCPAMTTDSVSAGPSERQNQILKVSLVVKRLERDVLYVESGATYSLRAVRVDYSHYKAQPSSPGKRRIADLFFVNGVLKEVTIQ